MILAQLLCSWDVLHCALPGAKSGSHGPIDQCWPIKPDIPNLRHCTLQGLDGRLGNGSDRWFTWVLDPACMIVW